MRLILRLKIVTPESTFSSIWLTARMQGQHLLLSLLLLLVIIIITNKCYSFQNISLVEMLKCPIPFKFPLFVSDGKLLEGGDLSF